MRILLVMDQIDSENNGTTISAKRFAEKLAQHGNQVRAVSTGEEKDGKYVVRELKIPFFNGLIHSQGMHLAIPDGDTLEQAIRWADVVHFLMPFALSVKGLKIARELGVPHTAAFHVQPENVTFSIGLGNVKLANQALYRGFRDIFYNHFTHIHCPSQFIADQLKKNGYTAQLHIISNGIAPEFHYRKLPKSPELAGKIVLLMVGRLSAEKRQDVFLNAVLKSKYADKIQVILAGQGPKKKAIEELGLKLPHAPIIQFYEKSRLLDILAMSDLYVHAADVEIEAISCVEAFSSGLVPVIANSSRSATPQFALDDRSLFEAGNSEDLARKIDYWIEHEAQRREMERRYSELGKRYQIDGCVSQIEEMFRQAIQEQREG
ncbi:MAG: glycosyltransferase [Oscillospiraceae bacterium]